MSSSPWQCQSINALCCRQGGGPGLRLRPRRRHRGHRQDHHLEGRKIRPLSVTKARVTRGNHKVSHRHLNRIITVAWRRQDLRQDRLVYHQTALYKGSSQEHITRVRGILQAMFIGRSRPSIIRQCTALHPLVSTMVQFLLGRRGKL